jgi:sugar lactone lactonase YvrE
MKWKEFGIDIAERNQLKNPSSILIDDDETIYIVDSQNDRILKWKFNEHYNEIVAGGHGKGKQLNQLMFPKDVIIDKENDCFIISDYGNKRIVQWSRHNNEIGQIGIPNISCQGLAIDKYGFIYVADSEKHAVRKWKIGDPIGKLVAGGNGKGNSFKQLAGPQGIFVDQSNQIYVADRGNNRVMCWYEGATKGNIVVGRNGYGNELNQLFYPMGLSFDQQGNLYVVDSGNNRIQKFEIDLN